MAFERKRLKESNGKVDIRQSAAKNGHKLAGANGVLSRLFLTILNDLGIRWLLLDKLLDSYIRDTRNGIPNNRKDMTTAKGNLVAFITSPQMTWKTFTKTLRILRFTKVTLSITAEHMSGKKTVHSTVIELGNEYDAIEFERRLNQSEESELNYESTTNMPWPIDNDENDPASPGGSDSR